MKLAEQIIQIRKDNNLTQEELAESLFVTRQAVSKWERGISVPDVETLKRISILYKVSLNVLLGIVEEFKSEEFKPLAYKEKKSLLHSIIFLMLSVIIIIFSILNFHHNHNYSKFILYLFLGIILIIISLILVISKLKMPGVLIEYNDFGILLKYPEEVFIKYDEIEDVNIYHDRIKRIHLKFGSINIITKDKTYSLNGVKKIDLVQKEIIVLKTKNTTSIIS